MAFAVALAAGAFLSWFCEKANHGLLQKRRASTDAHFISALGLYLLISEVAAILWGSETKATGGCRRARVVSVILQRRAARKTAAGVPAHGWIAPRHGLYRLVPGHPVPVRSTAPEATAMFRGL